MLVQEFLKKYYLCCAHTPGRRQAIIWTNGGTLSIRPLGINFCDIVFENHIFSFKQMYLKMSSRKWRPFCLGLNLLIFISERGPGYVSLWDSCTLSESKMTLNFTNKPLLCIYLRHNKKKVVGSKILPCNQLLLQIWFVTGLHFMRF